MPVGMTLMILIFFASMGMPGFVGFISEFLVLLGFFQAYGFWVLLIGAGIIISVGYYLWAFQRIAFGQVPKSLSEVTDIKRYEGITISILLVLIVYLGLQPHQLFSLIDGKIIAILAGI